MRLIFTVIWISLLMSCKESAPVTPESGTETKLTNYQDTISEATFLDWTNNWNVYGKAFSDTLLIRYYDMPVIDLEQTLTEDPFKARFYHGLKDLGGGHYEAHLVLTAVDSLGNDEGPYFDISQPCPPMCRK